MTGLGEHAFMMKQEEAQNSGNEQMKTSTVIRKIQFHRENAILKKANTTLKTGRDARFAMS
ncbi:hypothetical protein [uncultured Bartonella sp.]|uniref:hypothetical protein n=1 Tax=uncultured Bartonella sp. TaxID=104108 RepID=UPI0025DCA759|nr:hypothetical protein [uncultured Bartonella sp.]